MSFMTRKKIDIIGFRSKKKKKSFLKQVKISFEKNP